MIQIFQIKIIANQSSIFLIICNHLNKTKRKRTKQLSNTQQKNRKLQLFGWSHVDDADDTDDTDRSVTDNRQQTDGRLTSSIFRWSPTQKALKGNNFYVKRLKKTHCEGVISTFPKGHKSYILWKDLFMFTICWLEK